MRWLPLVLLLGCTRKIPDHLQVVPPTEATRPTSFADSAALVAFLVGGDPLVRAPVLPADEVLEAVDPAIADWATEVRQLERGEGSPAQLLQQLEERFPGTVIVPLARGYRLRMAENQLGNLQSQVEDPQNAVALLLSPLQSTPASLALTKDPLHFLRDGDDASGIRAYGDRWVLGAWLHAPGIPTDAVASALEQPQWDRLAELPEGMLLRSRHRQGDPNPGFALLERATLLSLLRTAADRDTEQAAWADTKLAARTELGVDDPVRELLQQAHAALLTAAGDDDAAGGALIASTALRWLEVCEPGPCSGFDRTELFGAAAAWGPRSAQLARTWKVIALKDAIDTMEVGHDTVLFPKAAVALVDALVGTGAGPLDTGLLRRSRGDETTWLTLTRAVGSDPAVDWTSARHALGLHLERTAETAIVDQPAGEVRDLLSRISKRANR